MNEVKRASTITVDLFRQYVAWIDRGEKTTRTYLTNLKQFLYYLQDHGIAHPDRDDVIAYRDELTARGLKPATVAAYIRALRSFFAWTSSVGIYPDIASNIHPPKVDHSDHKRDALSPQEVREVERFIDENAARRIEDAAGSAKDSAGRVERAIEQGARDRAMFLIAVTAGLRTVELSRANVRDLETKDGQTYLYVFGKGCSEASQKKALAPEVADAVRKYIEVRKGDQAGPLFVATGNRSGGNRLSPTTISTMIKRMLQGAGLDSPRLTAHSLRHSAGTAAYTVTSDLFSTQKYMRHSSPVTTEIYLHTDDDRRDAMTAALIYDYFHGDEGSV